MAILSGAILSGETNLAPLLDAEIAQHRLLHHHAEPGGGEAVGVAGAQQDLVSALQPDMAHARAFGGIAQQHGAIPVGTGWNLHPYEVDGDLAVHAERELIVAT